MRGRRAHRTLLARALVVAALLASSTAVWADTLVLLDTTRDAIRMSISGRVLDSQSRPLTSSRLIAYRTDGAFWP